MKYLICGKGTVGEAWGGALESWEHEIEYYDPPKNIKPDSERFDGAFICAPTPTEDERPIQDLSAVIQSLKYCENKIETDWISIRSTVFPNFLTQIKNQERFSTKLFAQPEFLRERHAEYEAKNPKLIVIGGKGLDEKGKYYREIYPDKFLKTPEILFYESQEEAMFYKYAANILFATKVIYANTMREIYDNIPGGNKHSLKKVLNKLDTMFSGRHMDPYHGDKFGYGGKCLPKDTRVWSEMGYELIDAITEQNRRYRDEKIS